MVDILMATYNGADFIAEQIQSIIDQSYRDWRLILHDDGSSDATLKIIEQFCGRDERIRLIDDGKTHLGVAKNFIHLLDFSESEFVMFCDQDDIWFTNKVETMVAAIETKDNTRPQAIFANAYLWNEQKGIISNRNTLFYPRQLRDLFFLNSGVQGASSIFNAPMRQILQVPLDFYAMHDHVLTLAAIALGEIDYIDKPLMKYRQHANNFTGNAPGSMRKKVEQLVRNRHNTVIFTEHYRGLQSFYECHKHEISAENQQVIESFLKMPSQNFVQRLRTIFQNRFSLFGSTWLLLLKVCFRKFI
jgi:glycosyltransferase involved in cell wall biosynthesis